ncbi:hypothetical protein F2Q69_00052517 [Brassica cretica]|uniref:Uncharacterized protein n=1 Tax=Brassica cretica TaxID=69181 RepID=A0A8S9N3K2_BRACR|nr:hypothetical protein F2Q69_00052517 [Brassica cretica]
MELDGVYYPLNDSIIWLTNCMEDMRQDIARIQRANDVSRSISIDRHRQASVDSRLHASIDNRLPASVDDNPPHSHTMKSQPDFHTRGEKDQLSYIARRPKASALLDKSNNISTDIRRQTSVDDATNRGRLVQKVTSDMFGTHNHGEEISADTYATVMRPQFNLESLGERLQKIEDATTIMKDKWRRGDEAMRDFTALVVETSTIKFGTWLLSDLSLILSNSESGRYALISTKSLLSDPDLTFRTARFGVSKDELL